MQVFPSKPCCNGIPLNGKDTAQENNEIGLDPCCNGIPLNEEKTYKQ